MAAGFLLGAFILAALAALVWHQGEGDSRWHDVKSEPPAPLTRTPRVIEHVDPHELEDSERVLPRP